MKSLEAFQKNWIRNICIKTIVEELSILYDKGKDFLNKDI